MKKLILLLLFIIVSTLAIAQTTWTGAGTDNYWSNTDNWNTNIVPTAADDVIIPTGFTVFQNLAGSIKSIVLQGNSVLEMGYDLIITNPSTFGVNTIVNWGSGTISGNTTLTNNGQINTVTFGSTISGGITLNNQGIITTESNLTIGNDCILNNPTGSTINLKGPGYLTSSGGNLGVFNNAGLIKKTTGVGSAIQALMNNNNGTIQVEEGLLVIHFEEKNFNDGFYNVFAGATMNWETTINPTGTLSGTIDGDLNWDNIVNIPTGQTATFNFSEDDNFNWTGGTLSGGGTLINSNAINSIGLGSAQISGGSTLDNQGVLNVTAGINLSDGSTLNNPVGGIIHLQGQTGQAASNISSSGGNLDVFNNAGLLKRTTQMGSVLSIETINSGTINNAVTGLLVITETGTNHFTNEVTGVIKGVGVFRLPAVANYTNNGTFAPGLSPGTLTVEDDFVSTATSVLDIELNGLAQGTEYDLLAIQGDAVLEGSIHVTMGFVANVNDEFVILTANNITTCNLPSTVTGSFNNMEHTFDVICNPNNITLKVLNIILGSNDTTLETNSIAYPNPTDGNFTIDIGKIFTEITVITSNILGQIIASEKFENTNSIQLKIEGKTGIYFVKLISSEGNSKTLKIIKN